MMNVLSVTNKSQLPAAESTVSKNLFKALVMAFSLLLSANSFAQTLISITNAPTTVTTTAVGGTQFWPDAGTVNGTPVSLRATVDAITGSIRLFTSGDNPVVRTNLAGTMATITWEITNTATGAPITADPNFLITDIDGTSGTPNESVSAACEGLTSYTVNGNFVAGCNANDTPLVCQTNIQVSESGGNILAEGTQNQSGAQQEGYMQYSWTGVDTWVVSYMSVTSGRWFVHDADGDVPFDGTEVAINLVDMATIKGVSAGSLTSPAVGEQITFEIEMSNLGPENATGGNLLDTLPVGLNVISATATNGNVTVTQGSPDTVAWDSVSVTVGGIQTLTVVAEVIAPAAAGDTLTNSTTTALANESVCSSRDELTYSFVVAEIPDPSLTVAKSVSAATAFSAAGDTITYSYLVTNTGNVNIDNVVPTDAGPTFNGVAATNALVAFTPASATITPGNSQTFTATYLLDQADVDNMAQDVNPLLGIDNTASATGVPTGGALPLVPDSTAETGFAPMPSLTIVKAVSGVTVFDEAGDTITYQYTITNDGNITIDGVAPTDSGPTFNGAPAASALSALSPATASIAPGGNQVFTATYVLQQVDVDNVASSADPLTAIDNVAGATGDPVGATPLPAVTESMAETGFAPAPSMVIVKSVSAATTFSQAGDTITYEYVVDNTGNVVINNAVPTDSGPTFNGIVGMNALSAFSPTSATIAPNDPPVTFTATYVLSQQDIDNMSLSADPATAIDNTASATGTPTGGVLPVVPDSMAETGFVLNAELTMAKTAGAPSIGLGSNPAATDAGDTIAYSFDVTNSGDVTIDTLVINDIGPTFNSMAGTGSLSAISCPLTSLAPTQMTTCTATYTLSQVDVDNAIVGGPNAVENTATAAGEDPSNAGVTSPDATATQTIVSDSSIEIVKSAGAPTIVNGADPTLVDPGDTVTYQLDVNNTGNTTLSGILISDSIAAVTCPATTNLGAAFVNDGSAQLAVGDGIVCTAIYTLLQIDLDSGGVQNTADVASTDPTGAATNDSSVVDSGFTQKTSVSLVKSATALPDPASVGDPITYTFELTNTGNVTLTSAQIVDPICETPASPLTFASGYVMGDAGVAGEMEAGETWVFECEYTIDLDDVNLGEVANTATGSGTPPPGSGLPAPENTASNLADAAQEAAIALDKSSSLPTIAAGALASATDVGDTVAYSFEVENTGNVTLTNVAVTDPLITGAPNNGTINCPAGISSMAPGSIVTCTATYNVTQVDIDAGMITNTGSATGTPPPSVPPADAPQADSSNMVTIAPMPDLNVTKSVGALSAPLTVGGPISYSFLVENTGNVTVNGVVPVDSGPTFNGAAATGTLSAFAPVSADLLPGTSQIFTASYTLTQDDLDNIAAAADPLIAIDNSATANGTPENGSLPPVDPSTTETGVAPAPQVELLKSSTPPVVVEVGADITYSFELTNSGNVTLASPIVTDARCAMPGTVLNFASGYVSGDTGPTAQALDVGETWIFSCTYAISQADINAGTVQNTATGGGQDPGGNTAEDDSDSSNPGDDTGANDDPTNTPLAQTSSWTVVKSTTSMPSLEGDTLVYQFVVDNTGTVDISSVSVVDAKCAATPVLVGGDIGGDLVLSPPEVWTFECTSIQVTQAEVDDGMVDNEVDVTGSVPPTAPALPIAEDDESTPILPVPALTVDKSSAAPTTGLGNISTATDVGDTIVYSFDVENTGNVTITSLVVADTGPTFGGNPGTGVWSGVSCPVSALVPLQTTTCSATYTLSQDDIDAAVAAGPDSIVNEAEAQGEDPDLGGVTSPTDEERTSIDSDADILILKTTGAPTVVGGADPALTDPGDTVDFEISVENTGNTLLSNVTIVDTLTSVTCPATTDLGNPFVNGGDLAVGDSVLCTAQYSIQQFDIDSGQVVNIATVTSTDPAGDPVDGVDDAITPFTQKTSLALIKTASVLPTAPPPAAGDIITYTFMLENTGNVTLSGAQVADPQCQIPAGPLTATNGLDALTDVGSDGLLAAGEIWTFACDYALTTADIIAGEVTNTATGSGTPPVASGLDDPSSTSSALVLAEQNAAITLDKVAGMPTVAGGTLPTVSDVGDTVTFTFNIDNNGNLPFDTVSLSDPLITDPPNNGTFSCVLDDGLTLFTLDSTPLPVGEGIICTAPYTLTQDDIDAGMVANVATAAGDPPGAIPPPPEGTSGSMVPIISAPSMTVAKSASAIPATVADGTVITYTYLVENTGNVTIDNVVPVDVGPTFNGVAGTNTLSVYTPLTATLAPGASQSFEATYVISQQDLDNMAAAADPTTAIDNEATVGGEPAQGTIPPVPPSMVETGIEVDPQLELIKTSVAPSPAIAGANIVYTFMLSNTGNVSIFNPVVNDPLCTVPSSVLSFASGYVSGDTGVIPQALDVGETWEFSCTYAISQADINAGTVQNTATAAGQDPGGNAVEDDSDSNNPGDDTGADDDPTNTPLTQTPSWTVVKSTSSTPMQLGDTLLYQFVVDNTGNVDISSVVVADVKCAAAPVLVSGDVGGDLVLSPPEVWTFTCTSIGVTQDEVNDGMADNEVTVTGSAPPTSSPIPPASDDISTPIAPEPELTVAKSSAPPTTGLGNISTATDAGDTIVYSFVVENTGNVTITGVTVADTGPTFGGNTGTGTWTGVTCPTTTLLPTQTTTCSATYTLSQDDIDAAIAAGPNLVVNSAQADGLDPDGGATPSDPSEEITSIDSAPEISILKTTAEPTVLGGADPALTDPGDTVTFTIAVENTGNTTLSNVLVVDTLTAVTCPATASPSGDPFTNAGDAASILAVGDSVLCTATYTIDQDDINSGQVLNTATVTSTDPAGDPADGTDDATTSFTQKTSLALIKTASAFPVAPPPAAGDTITYTFTLENTGNVTLTGAQVADPQCEIPVGPLTATNGLDIATDVNNDQLLDAGETWSFMCDYALTGADIIAGEVINTATGSGTPPADSGLDDPSSSASALVFAEQNAAINLDKVAGLPTVAGGTLPTVADAGDTVTFTFNVDNNGNVPFDTVSVSDPLITDPPNNGAFTCLLDDGVTPFALDTDPLPVGDGMSCNALYTLTQDDIDNGTVSNVATVAGDPPGTIAPPPDGTSASMVPIPPAPSMTVAKSASAIPASVAAGTVITYTYLVENTGNVTIANVVPVDAGPTFNGVAGSNALSAYSPTSVTLAPGVSQSFTATYVISQQDLDNMAAAADPTTAIDNEATANGDPENGSLPPVPPSTVETGVAPSPALELIKTSAVTAPVAAGSVITYTFTLANVGNVTIANPIVTDALCQSPGSPLSFTSGYISGDTGVIAQSLDVGETWEYTCDYVVSQTDMDAGTVQNTAVGSGQNPDGSTTDDNSDSGNPGDDTGGGSDPTNTELPRNPNWMIEKSTLSVPTAAGQTLNYTFVVTNLGNTSISAITVSDAKCVGGVAIFDPATDVGGDVILSPAGATGVPAAEQWTYSCVSIPVTQAEMNLGQIINDVIANGTAPGGGLDDATDQEITEPTQTPAMSLVKSAGAASLNANGSFDQVFDFVLKNTGNVSLDNVVISDNIPAQFGDCYVGVAQPGVASVNDAAPAGDTLNSALGSAPVIATADVVGVGDSLLVTGFSVTFDPNAAGCAFPDPAENSASGSSDLASDVSDNGTDPDMAGSNDSGIPTPFVPPLPGPQMGIAKSAAILAFNADFTFDVEFTLLLQNTGDVDLTTLSLFDDISAQTGAAFSPSTAADTSGGILAGPTVTVLNDAVPVGTVLPALNSLFDGRAQNVFDGVSGSLGVGDVIEVRFSIRLNPTAIDPLPDSFENVASGSGAAPDGSIAQDESNDGSDPTAGAGGDGSPTVVSLDDVAALPITLGLFTSQRVSEGQVLITWQTQTEVANLGFNLYGQVDGEWQLLNSDVIPSKGDSVMVVDYEYQSDTQAGSLAISDIDARGKETLHGPFKVGVSYGAVSQRQATDWRNMVESAEDKKAQRVETRRTEMLKRNRVRINRRKAVGE